MRIWLRRDRLTPAPKIGRFPRCGLPPSPLPGDHRITLCVATAVMRTRYDAYLDGLVSRGLPGDWLSGVRISAASNKGKGVNSMICPRYIVFDDAPQDRRLGWTADHLLTHCAPRSRRLVCASSDNTALDPTHPWPAFKFADGRAANTTPNSIRSTTWSMCHEASGKEGIAERPGRLWVSVKLSCLAKVGI